MILRRINKCESNSIYICALSWSSNASVRNDSTSESKGNFFSQFSVNCVSTREITSAHRRTNERTNVRARILVAPHRTTSDRLPVGILSLCTTTVAQNTRHIDIRERRRDRWEQPLTSLLISSCSSNATKANGHTVAPLVISSSRAF